MEKKDSDFQSGKWFQLCAYTPEESQFSTHITMNADAKYNRSGRDLYNLSSQ